MCIGGQVYTHIVQPKEAVNGRVGSHVAFQVNVAAFTDDLSRETPSQNQVRNGRICLLTDVRKRTEGIECYLVFPAKFSALQADIINAYNRLAFARNPPRHCQSTEAFGLDRSKIDRRLPSLA